MRTRLFSVINLCTIKIYAYLFWVVDFHHSVLRINVHVTSRNRQIARTIYYHKLTTHVTSVPTPYRYAYCVELLQLFYS